MYENTNLYVSENQRDKLVKALKDKKSVSIRLNPSKSASNILLGLTKAQVDNINKAFEQNKGISVRLSYKQLNHTLNIEGGFLPFLAGLLPAIIPALASIGKSLATGALTGLATTGVQKALGGGSIGNTLPKGLYCKRNNCFCQIETDGKGLFLRPYEGNGLHLITGDGIYLSNGTPGGIISGDSLTGNGILGNLVKDIPILNWIL